MLKNITQNIGNRCWMSVNCENFAVMTGFHHPSEQKSMGYDLFIPLVTQPSQRNKSKGFTRKIWAFLLKLSIRFI